MGGGGGGGAVVGLGSTLNMYICDLNFRMHGLNNVNSIWVGI